MNQKEAWTLLKEYNKEPFHLKHAQTVGLVLRYFAENEGFGEEADFWECVGLLHDIDFELYPEQHCVKALEILRSHGVDERTVHAVASHGNGVCIDLPPEHRMEKILFAVDELTGLIGAAALMRPSKSAKDMELKSLKKKFKDKKFAAGCDRDIIARGAEELGLTLDELLEKTLAAYAAVEDDVNNDDYYA
jgi:predicted hydrolase (HD superfamily)